MDADEREIYHFLKHWRHEFISAREICRRAGGRKRFQKSPEWAKPILQNMVERGILEADSAGHFRIKPVPHNTKMKRWVSPQIAAILKSSGSTELHDIAHSDDDADTYYDKL
jgi:hypothetical protein